jgi:nicotinamidase-related amidase
MIRSATTVQLLTKKRSICLSLKEKQIEEIHIVGLDTYDCITATAHEASDLGFYTYIIEECCQATTSQELHERAVANLRQTKLTNNSCIENIDFIQLSVA